MFKNLWKRTKHVASTYTGTFIVVMLLNQLLFFGFCLNPICLIAAMPHVLLISVAIGSWINKTSSWGAIKIEEGAPEAPQTRDSDPSKKTIPEKIEGALDAATTSLNSVSTKIEAFNVTLSAKSEYAGERFFINANLEISESTLAVQQKLDADPELAKIFEEVESKFREHDKPSSADASEPEIKKVAKFILPEGFDNAGRGQEIKAAIDKIVAEHSQFLKDVKRKLDRNPDLMAIFELEMEQRGGKKILERIKAIDLPDIRLTPKPTGSRGPLDGTASSADKCQKRSISTKRLPKENPHKFGETPDEFLQDFNKSNPRFSNRINIRTQAEEFKIPHLVHFTRCENLPSILRHGLLSVVACEADNIRAIRNDKLRLDGQPDGISLSVTFPNYRMFYKYRKLDIAADWAVLILSPRILWEKKCGFYKYNAADSRMRNLPRWKATSPEAFRKMFETPDARREHWLRPYDPTDPQAEVMVYERIEAELIETVAFETKATAEKWKHALGGIEAIYAGQGKGLFASRTQVRQN